MQIAIATGWTPDVVRDLTLSELDALRAVFKERARAMKAR
jgi:hypothetical protein